MRVLAFCLLAMAICVPARGAEAPPHPLDGTVWEVATGQRIGRDALADRLAGADIVIIGEIHDNPAQHEAQAWLVGRLKPAGIALEMIQRADENRIRAFLAEGGDPASIGPAIGWEKSGWPDWALYRPIFEAWRPGVYTGGGLPRAALMAAGEHGAATVAPEGFGPTLATPLAPATEAAMENEMVEAHCGRLPRSAAPGMVQVQRLRDASFAAAALRARQEGGGKAVLITGDGHARTDRGVPVYLHDVAPGLTVASVGLIETAPDARTLSAYGDLPYDYVWFTAPAERPDPCLSFDAPQGG